MLTQEKLLEEVNKVRKAAGLEELEELLPAKGSLGDSCLVAENLNCDCSVIPQSYIGGYITSADERLQRAAKLCGWDRVSGSHYAFELPPVFEEAALMFDLGEWPGELYPKEEALVPPSSPYTRGARRRLAELRGE